MVRTKKLIQVFFLALLLTVISLSASADIFRVVRPDGSVVYTNKHPAPGSDCRVVVSTGKKTKKKATGGLNALITPGSGRAWHYLPRIEAISSQYGIDPNLVVSVIEVESGFNPTAISPKGAQGLMQLMPDTAKMLGVKNAFDPDQNLEGGIRYLSYLNDLFDKNLSLVLAAYNSGEGRVMRLGRVPRISETLKYVDRVTRLYLGPNNRS